MGNIVDPAARVATLDGFADAELHPQIVEAIKVLHAAKEAHQRALASLDAQYLKPLEAAHDGDDAACIWVQSQVKAVRSSY
jgi:hypothetical protein